MADLDPRLQQAAAEYLEHQNRQLRIQRKYGWIVALVMIAIFAAVAFWMKRSHDRDVQQMNEDYERRVREMDEQHDQRVREMDERFRSQLPPNAR